MTLNDLLKMASQESTCKVAVAAAHDEPVVEAIVAAKHSDLAKATLIGHSDDIAHMLIQLNENPNDYDIIHADSDVECAILAVKQVRDGKANLLMKGLLSTADLLRAVLDKENGLRAGKTISHLMMYECTAYPKPIVVTDGGMNTFPDFDGKKNILKNAAEVLHLIGYDHINAACVCGAEKINPKIQSTVDAANLSALTDEWSPYHMSVYGPVGLDMAISKEACQHKGYDVPGAGEADILLVPNYEMGNGIAKSLSYFGGAENAGIVVGAKVPIILVSRADSAKAKLYSIALGSVVTNKMSNHTES